MQLNPKTCAVSGVNIGKTLFHVVGLDASGAPIQKAKLRRGTVLQFFAQADDAVGRDQGGASGRLQMLHRVPNCLVKGLTNLICQMRSDTASRFVKVPWHSSSVSSARSIISRTI